MKRIISIILSLMMVLSLFTGLNISAAETDTADTGAEVDAALTGASLMQMVHVNSWASLLTALEKDDTSKIYRIILDSSINGVIGYDGDSTIRSFVPYASSVGKGTKYLDLNGHYIRMTSPYVAPYACEEAGLGQNDVIEYVNNECLFSVPDGADLFVGDCTADLDSSGKVTSGSGEISYDGVLRNNYGGIDNRDIFHVNGGKLTINSGSFGISQHVKSYSYGIAQINGTAVTVNRGSAVINGGTFNGIGSEKYGDDTNNPDFRNGAVEIKSPYSHIEINGGKFLGTNQGFCFIARNDVKEENIKFVAGTFFAENDDSYFTTDLNDIRSKRPGATGIPIYTYDWRRNFFDEDGKVYSQEDFSSDRRCVYSQRGKTLYLSPVSKINKVDLPDQYEQSYGVDILYNGAAYNEDSEDIEWDGNTSASILVDFRDLFFRAPYPDIDYRTSFDGVGSDMTCKATLLEYISDGNQPTLAGNIDVELTKVRLGNIMVYGFDLTSLPESARSKIVFGKDYRIRFDFTEIRYAGATYTYKITRYAYFSFSFTKEITLSQVKATFTEPKVGDSIKETFGKISPVESEKYTASVAKVIRASDYKEFEHSYDASVYDKIESGDRYSFIFRFSAKPGYKIDNSTKIYINSTELPVKPSFSDLDANPPYIGTGKAYDFGYSAPISSLSLDMSYDKEAVTTLQNFAQPVLYEITPSFGDTRFTFNNAYDNYRDVAYGIGWYNVSTDSKLNWYSDDSAVFEKGYRYRLTLELKTASGFKFASDLKAANCKINGVAASSITRRSDSAVTLTYYFTCSDNYKIKDVNISGTLKNKIAMDLTPPSASDIILPSDARYSLANRNSGGYINGVKWTDKATGKTYADNRSMKFEQGKTYTLELEFEADSFCEFIPDVYAHIGSTGGALEPKTKTLSSLNSTLDLLFEFYIPVTYYTGTFDPNGGGSSMSAVQVQAGDPFIFPECTILAPQGMKFRGWEIKGDPSRIYLPGADNFTPSSDFTVIAKWQPANPDIDVATYTVEEPASGEHPAESGISGDSEKYQTGIVGWYQVTPEHEIIKSISKYDTFESNATYACVVKFRAIDMYQFTDSTRYLINNQEVQEFTPGSSTFVRYFTVAPKAYKLWVGDTQVTEANQDDILGGGSGVTFDPATGVLTLDDLARVDGYYTGSSLTCKIYASSFDLTIKGSFWMDSSNCGDIGVCVANGNLTFDCDYCYFYGKKLGVSTSGNVTVNGGRVSAIALNGGQSGIHANKLIINSGAESVYAECYGTYSAIDCNNAITVDPALELVNPAGGDVYGSTVWTSDAHTEEAKEVLWEKPAGPATKISKVVLTIDDMGQPFRMPEDGSNAYGLMTNCQTEGIMASQPQFYDENNNWADSFAAGHTYTVKIDFEVSIDGNYELTPDFTATINGKTATVEKMGGEESRMYRASYTYPKTPAADVVIDEVEITDMWELNAGNFFFGESANVTEGCTLKAVKLYASEGDAMYDEGALPDDHVLEAGYYWVVFTLKADNGYVFAIGEDNAPNVTATVMGDHATVDSDDPNPRDKYIKVIGKVECTAPSGYTVNVTVQSFLDDAEPVRCVLRNKTDPPFEMSDTKTSANGFAEFIFTLVPNGSYTMMISKKNHVTRTYDVTVDGDHVQITDAKICPIGDVDNNGRVNAADAKAAFQHGNEQKLITDDYKIKCADVAGPKNRVNSADAKAIFQHANEQKSLWVD